MDSRPRKFLLLSRRANIIVLLITLLSAGVIPVVLTFYSSLDREIVSTVRTILYIILGIVLGANVLDYLLTYLEPAGISRELDAKAIESSDTFRILSEGLKDIREQIKSLETVSLNIKNVTDDELLKSLSDSLKSSVNERFTEDIFKSIDEEFAKREIENKRLEGFITGFDEIRKRLVDETNNLAVRANLNLSLGGITTALALIGLLIIVFTGSSLTSDFADILSKEIAQNSYSSDSERLRSIVSASFDGFPYGWLILSHYIPRISLVIFAELFAYFFLKLYKSGLEDIKYYQNELTNVELKLSALKTALATEDHEIIKLVIGELAKAERNFVLKKGETTVEVEKYKVESLNTKELVAQIGEFLKIRK